MNDFGSKMVEVYRGAHLVHDRNIQPIVSLWLILVVTPMANGYLENKRMPRLCQTTKPANHQFFVCRMMHNVMECYGYNLINDYDDPSRFQLSFPPKPLKSQCTKRQTAVPTKRGTDAMFGNAPPGHGNPVGKLWLYGCLELEGGQTMG